MSEIFPFLGAKAPLQLAHVRMSLAYSETKKFRIANSCKFSLTFWFQLLQLQQLQLQLQLQQLQLQELHLQLQQLKLKIEL